MPGASAPASWFKEQPAPKAPPAPPAAPVAPAMPVDLKPEVVGDLEELQGVVLCGEAELFWKFWKLGTSSKAGSKN